MSKLEEAVAAAMGQTDEESAEGTAPEGAEATPDEASTTEPVVDTEEGGATVESEAEGEASPEGTDEPPTTYFGEDLSGFSADQRREVIAMLEKRDDFIGKHLQAKAEGEGETPPPAEEAEPVTDEAILQAFGLDPEDPYDEKAIKVALPLFKKLDAQDRQLSDVVQRLELQDIEREWNSTLEALSKENGELPVSNLAVMEYAAENGIASPTDAYWRIAGPARRQVTEAMKAVTSRMKADDAKKAAASTRPAATQTEESLELPEDVKSATAKAAKSVMEKLGLGS